jgi:hypothetical protein
METPGANRAQDVNEWSHGIQTDQPSNIPNDTPSLGILQPVQLEFIISNLSPSESRTGHDSSRVIRSHAMRHHIRQTKLLSSLDIADVQPNKPNLSKGAVGKFKLSTWSRASSKAKRVAKDSRLLPDTASFTIPEELGLINVLPIEKHPHTHRLLYHCTYLECHYFHWKFRF